MSTPYEKNNSSLMNNHGIQIKLKFDRSIFMPIFVFNLMNFAKV